MPLYWIWFSRLRGIGLMKKLQLLQKFANPEELYLAQEPALETLDKTVREALGDRDLSEAAKILEQCKQQRIGILTFADAAYPKNLRNIEDPPLVLYFRGKLPDWEAQPMIGVVGTRRASSYGLHTAELLSAQIAACGGMVISGAAAGIDKAAMETALGMGKPVVGVVGGGVDVVYPAANRTLYSQTEENGCILSEYLPGSRPFAGNFLRRNRIISGISQGVLVVEAPEKSGALSTARYALSQGRDVFTVPANLGVDTSLGSNRLLQEGAYPVFSGWDVLKHYAPLYPGVVENRPAPVKKQADKGAETAPISGNRTNTPTSPAKNPIDNQGKSTYSGINKQPADLSQQESDVLSLLDGEPQLIDSVLNAAELPSGTVQSILTRLTIKGLVKQYPDGRISKK